MNIGEKIKKKRKEFGISQQEIATGLDVSRNAVSMWESGETRPGQERLPALAKILAVSVDWLVSDREDEMPPELRAIRAGGPEQSDVVKIGEGWPDVGHEWMDVHGVAVGGDDAAFYFGDVIDKVRRPPGIRNAKNVAALNAIGDSMVPRFNPGELLYIQLREPVPGDDVVIELYPEVEGDAPKAFLKQLVRTTGRRIYCKQHNPKREIEFDRGEVNRLWRVLTLRDLLG
jgi:phage repressor protein C with HTH and peptisase S24 domain